MPDSARYAAQSDPDRNFHFSRRWTEPTALDRAADFHLQQGYAATAERLSHLAAAVRQTDVERYPAAVPR